MKKYSLVVWDWNGTLLDDVDANLRTANRMLKCRGLNEIESKDDYRRLFCFPVVNFYNKVGFDLDAEDFGKIAEEYVVTYTEENASSALFSGARETLSRLKEENVRQVIVSATEHERLRLEVESHGVSDMLEDILGVGDNYGNSKISVAKAFVEGCGVHPTEILFVGDTCHDSEVAGACGCDCVLVAGGHISAESLAKSGRPVVNSINEVADLVI